MAHPQARAAAPLLVLLLTLVGGAAAAGTNYGFDFLMLVR